MNWWLTLRPRDRACANFRSCPSHGERWQTRHGCAATKIRKIRWALFRRRSSFAQRREQWPDRCVFTLGTVVAVYPVAQGGCSDWRRDRVRLSDGSIEYGLVGRLHRAGIVRCEQILGRHIALHQGRSAVRNYVRRPVPAEITFGENGSGSWSSSAASRPLAALIAVSVRPGERGSM